MNQLIHNSYGKSRVRLTKVTRHAERHDLNELNVDIELEGDFEATYLTGDNINVIATDSMKNTVYVLARNHPVNPPENFALHLAGHFLEKYSQVRSARVRMAAQPWERIDLDGSPHAHSFVGGSREQRVCTIRKDRNGTRVEGGLEDLLVLKTTDSAFTDFVDDQFRTLPDADDRILATSVTARWQYTAADLDWNACHQTIRRSMLRIFTTHFSKSVQQTLYLMGQAALEACPDISEITLHLPNSHRIPVNLEPFGLDNPNVIFVPTDEPFGMISGTLKRS